MMPVDLSPRGIDDGQAPLSTLCALFDHAVATGPETVALRHFDTALTWREMGRAVWAMARRLAELVAPGDVVALVLPNSIEFHIAYFATLKALAAPGLLNPLYPAVQLAPLLRDTAPRAILCVPANRDMIAELARELGIPGVICMGQDVTMRDLVAQPERPVGLRDARPDDPAALLFSGGTTGIPKAVEHTHRGLAFSVRSMAHIFAPRTEGDVFLAIAPYSHVYGLLAGVLLPLYGLGETVIPGRFQPEHIVELIMRHRVTFFGGGPPAIYAAVLAASNLHGSDLSSLRICPAGGAPFPVELLDRWRRATGLEIQEGYGMSEIAPISGPTEESGIKRGSVGKPVPGCEVQVVDLDDGVRVLPQGERGELRVCGPHMMVGYRNLPEETAQTILDGFIYTGDIGYIDGNGFVFITDRKKDVVFVKGFNVFPREVEEVIYTHPKVGMAGVVGAPDVRSGGERVIAFVVPRTGETVHETEIFALCASRLAGYKCPAELHVVGQLPMTAAHKLDRIALRRAVTAKEQSSIGNR